MADSTLLMITPKPTSLADAYSVAKILFARGINRIDVLVNMIETQRAYEVNSKAISTTEQMLSYVNQQLSSSSLSLRARAG